MLTCTDIRGQVVADAHLQKEINHALCAVADTLANGGNRRLARILTRTLEPSWAEHVSFQDEVIFPILIGRHGGELNERLDRGRLEHSSIAELHAEIARHLDDLSGVDGNMAEGLEALLRHTHAQRLSHIELDAQFDEWLPQAFSDAEHALCEKWTQTRPHPRFPLNLLRKGGHPFPRLGGRRLH